MSRTDFLRQGGTAFDGFLYAALGEDRGGNTVSVLSALARLGVDPWDEAADLLDLPREGARNRLDALLGRFGDVPALGRDQGMVIARLIDLLPKASGRQTGKGIDLPASVGAMGFGPIVVILMVVLFVLRIFILGTDGTGE